MIAISLSPNTTPKDALLALRLLVKPWQYRSGPTVDNLEFFLSNFFGGSKIYTVNSGRWAMYLLLKSLNLPETSEVIVQGFTCVSAVAPVLWSGLKPVYADIDEETLSMKPESLENKITANTRAVIIQHTFGVPARLNELLNIARKRNLIVIEDCAHTIGSLYENKPLGTFGDAAILSFGRDKAVSSVFGGAIILNNPQKFIRFHDEIKSLSKAGVFWTAQQLLHPVLFECLIKPFYFRFGIGKFLLVLSQKIGLLSKAIVAREKAGGKPVFPPARLPNALAALALKQLENIRDFNQKRKKAAEIYGEIFKDVSIVPQKASVNSNAYLLRYNIQTDKADEIFRRAKNNNILLGNWYEIIAPKDTDLSKIGYAAGSCPVAEKAAKESLNLPTNPNLSEEEIKKVGKFVKNELLVSVFQRKKKEQTMSLLAASRLSGVFIKKHRLSERTRDGIPPDGGMSRSGDKRDVVCSLYGSLETKQEWDSFISSKNPNTFLQSWAWGETQKELGEKVIRLGVLENGKLIGAAQAVTVTAKRGNFLFCPHGPLVDNSSTKKILIDEMISYANQNKLSFLRISPLELDSDSSRDFYGSLGFRAAPIHMHAETMWVLDIRLDEEMLLKGMRKTTRNLVRRAEKDGVKIRFSKDIADLKTFEKIYDETANRENFTGFSSRFLKAEFENLARDDRAFFAFAEYQNDIISGALITTFGNTGFYHQGASTRKWAKVPGAYLLQWEVIKKLKNQGLERYNFWGVALDDPKHPWAGLSLFKQGFGGYREDYLHAQDLPIRTSYWFTYIIEQIRRKKRGY